MRQTENDLLAVVGEQEQEMQEYKNRLRALGEKIEESDEEGIQ